MQTKLFFIHVPKTAGTSLRVSLEESLGFDNVLADYGPEATQTSALIRDIAYQHHQSHAPDLFQIMQPQHSFQVLTGHVTAKTYGALFQSDQIFTVIREPISRLTSEYFHFQRHFNFQGTLLEFAQQKGKRNLISRYLRNIPWQAMGYVGSSERYTEALNSLSDLYGLELDERSHNRRPAAQQLTINDHDMQVLRRLNQDDIRLYRQVNESLNWRRQCIADGKAYVHGLGKYDEKRNRLYGFAFYHSALQNEDPVSLSVFYTSPTDAGKQEICRQELIANQHDKFMFKSRLPRQNHCGFDCTIPQQAKAAQTAEIIVSSTGQPIATIPLAPKSGQ